MKDDCFRIGIAVMDWRVERYTGGFDNEIAAHILAIQNDEAGLDLTIEDQPDLRNVLEAYSDGAFWVAVNHNKVVGTIGLMIIGDRGILKKFFVAKDYRGRGGPAFALMTQLLALARELRLKELVLDTPSIAIRSHAFYERAGFEIIGRGDLGFDYDYPDRSSILMRKRLIE